MSTPSRFNRELYNNLIYDKKNYRLYCMNDRNVTTMDIIKDGNVNINITIQDDTKDYKLNAEFDRDKNSILAKNISELVFNILWKSTYGWASIKEVKT